MIRWVRLHAELPDSEPWAYEAEAGPLLLTVARGNYDTWHWSIGLVGGDGAELGQGTVLSESLAKAAARRAVVRTIAKITRALRPARMPVKKHR